MALRDRPTWDSAGALSPALFLVGGGLLLGHAGVQGIEAFTALRPPPDLFVTAGHLVAVVGLLGLYPVIAPVAPRLGRMAAVATLVATAGWAGMTTAHAVAVFGGATSLSGVLPDGVGLAVVVVTITAYTLAGVGALRADGGSRLVGALVLAPGALIVVLLADAAVTGASALDGVVIGGGLALSMLALGHRLRRWDRLTGPAAPATDASLG